VKATIPLLVLLLALISSQIHLYLNRWNGPNIIIISIDTLRPDHLGCYGYDRDTSRVIDMIARESVLFTNTYAHSNWTLPSHFSLFSSQYPTSHGVVTLKSIYEPNRGILASQYFKNCGFLTAAFTNGGWVHGNLGFDLGFDLYENRVKRLNDQRIFRWISKHRDRSFFLFLHTYRVHDYILKPENLEFIESDSTSLWKGPFDFAILKEYLGKVVDFSENERQGLIDLYDAAIIGTDRDLGELINYMKETGIYDSSIVIITSDHGEEFGDHGHLYHGDKLFDEQIRIPLIIHFPEGSLQCKKVGAPIRQIDIIPTLVDYLGFPCEKSFQGRSFLDAIRNERDYDTAVFSSAHHLTSFSLILGNWKFITYSNNVKDSLMDNTSTLYNLRLDPHEHIDYTTSYPEISIYLQEKLTAIRDSTFTRPPSIPSVGRIKKKLQEELKALGYLE
jgi:arylsulfatase A-like enzyme